MSLSKIAKVYQQPLVKHRRHRSPSLTKTTDNKSIYSSTKSIKQHQQSIPLKTSFSLQKKRKELAVAYQNRQNATSHIYNSPAIEQLIINARPNNNQSSLMKKVRHQRTQSLLDANLNKRSSTEMQGLTNSAAIPSCQGESRAPLFCLEDGSVYDSTFRSNATGTRFNNGFSKQRRKNNYCSTEKRLIIPHQQRDEPTLVQRSNKAPGNRVFISGQNSEEKLTQPSDATSLRQSTASNFAQSMIL